MTNSGQENAKILEDDAKQEPRLSRFRWLIIGLAFFITLVNYLDRSAIAYAITPLSKEFGLNDSDFGLVASAFGIGYMVMTVSGGVMVDKWGSHKVWAGAACLWSLCTACMGLAGSFWILFMLRTLLGLAEGPHFPALSRVMADWLPTNERARATGFALGAVPMASVIGAPLITQLIVHVGWKLMFVILGVLGLVWVIAWLWLFRDFPENCRAVSESELNLIRDGKPSDRKRLQIEIRHEQQLQGKSTWKFMLFNPSLLSANLAFFAFGYLLFFAMTWLPGYFEQTYGLQLKQVGIFLIAPWLCAAILLPLGGWLSDWLWLKTGSARIARSHMIWICQLASGLCFIPVMFTHSLTVSIAMISLGVGLGLMPNAAFYTLNCDLAKDKAATSVGIMDCFFAAAGIAAPLLTGVLAHATGNFSSGFGLLIFFTFVAVVAVICFQHPDKAMVA